MKLNVELDGSGPPLLLINGARCTVRSWDHVVDDLARHFTVVRHDIRGTGRSPAGPADQYTFENYCQDIGDICADHGFDRVSMWGMAWGARVALVTAALQPELVGRLVLSDLGIDPADPDAQRAGVLAARQMRAAAGLIDMPKPEGSFEHDDPDEMLRAMAATRLHHDLMPFVERVTAPTRLITGDHDPNLASSRRALAGFQHLAVATELEVVEHAGHGVLFDRPEVVVELALGHLLGTGRSDTGQ